MPRLKEKIAVVTGASKGIGAGIAERFGAEGAKVVVNYSSDRAGADRVVIKIKQAGGEAVAVQADVSKKQDVDRLFAETKMKHRTGNRLLLHQQARADFHFAANAELVNALIADGVGGSWPHDLPVIVC